MNKKTDLDLCETYAYDSNIIALNPIELVRWCKSRKKALSLSNAEIADKVGLPVGTIDRIFSENYSEFKYSSIQPVIAFLIGYSNEVSKPKDVEEALETDKLFNTTVEGYKLVIDNKNFQIQQLTLTLEKLERLVQYLKQENERMSSNLEENQKIMAKMSETISKLAEK